MPPKSAKSTPTKPAPPRVHRSKKTPSAVTNYLIFYNLVSAAAWGVVLMRLLAHMATDSSAIGVKKVLGLNGYWEEAVNRAKTGAADFGELTKWVQTGALLEVVHSALGLVRSGLGTTISQVTSRLLLVWYIAEQYPPVTTSPIFVTMVFAWSFTEIIRYTYYATGLLGIKIPLLEWLRYNTFYLMYPLGAGSEAWLIFLSATYAQVKYGTFGLYGTYIMLSIWPPALLFLMTHMHKQRRKQLRSSASASLKAATKASVASAPDTPARSTRSKSKAL